MGAVRETGNIIEYNNIARETTISKITVKKYINCLKNSFLIEEIVNYSKSARDVEIIKIRDKEICIVPVWLLGS